MLYIKSARNRLPNLNYLKYDNNVYQIYILAKLLVINIVLIYF